MDPEIFGATWFKNDDEEQPSHLKPKVVTILVVTGILRLNPMNTPKQN